MKKGRKWIFKMALALLPVTLASSCEQETTGEFTGLQGFYTCNESSSHSGFRKYIVEIDDVVNQSDNFIIANFHNLGDNEFLFTEYENDTLYIRNQVIGSVFINGKGKVYEDFRRIEMEYRTDDGVTILDYYALYER